MINKVDAVETWLDTMSYSHSGSRATQKDYRFAFQRFCNFIERTPEEILNEYEASTDRRFKRRYAMYLRTFIQRLQKEGYAQGTIRKMIFAVKSFLRYNDLPVGFVPLATSNVDFHNRDITRDEITELLRISHPRDRAFYVVMAQSGLRPSTIANLKVKDMEGILEDGTPIPCMIQVRRQNTKGRWSEYFSFMGRESVAHLKHYFKTREGLTPDSWVFTKFGHEDLPVNGSVMTHMFRKSVRKLRERGSINFETHTKQIGKKIVTRSDMRLYSLRKFFRKNAGMAGADFVNFWMGHLKALGVDLHYFSRDPEHHRKIYAEKAMPHLRLETATPSETDKIIAKQAEEIERLKTRINELERERNEYRLTENQVAELLRRIEKLEKQAQAS